MAASRSLVRFSLFQLISLATAVAAMGSWLLQDRTRSIVWLNRTLIYHTPATPESYKRPMTGFYASRFGVANPAQQLLPKAEIADGNDLFRVAHESGWKACRYHFHSNFDADITYQIQGSYKDVDLVGHENVQSAAILAYAHGYNECQNQIDQLLQQQTPNELRRKIAVRKSPSSPILILGILSGAVFLLAFRKRSPIPR